MFFIDESQRVTLSDIGSVAEIEKWAALEKSEIIKMQLVSQFRCNGSDGYLAWLDQALEIRETANYNLDGIDYDIRICDTPEEMEAIVLEKNRARNRARILAGYCWNWPKATRNRSLLVYSCDAKFELQCPSECPSEKSPIRWKAQY